MKRNYQSPTMRVVILQQPKVLLGSVTGVESNVGLNFGGGGSEAARGRETDSWDEDE